MLMLAEIRRYAGDYLGLGHVNSHAAVRAELPSTQCKGRPNMFFSRRSQQMLSLKMSKSLLLQMRTLPWCRKVSISIPEKCVFFWRSENLQSGLTHFIRNWSVGYSMKKCIDLVLWWGAFSCIGWQDTVRISYGRWDASFGGSEVGSHKELYSLAIKANKITTTVRNWVSENLNSAHVHMCVHTVPAAAENDAGWRHWGCGRMD